MDTIGGSIAGTDAPATVKENYLLTKTSSTAHIPDNCRHKNAKRAYAIFDKDLAIRMFGYRVIFQSEDMEINVPDPHASQAHKPIQRFAGDIIGELSQNYV